MANTVYLKAREGEFGLIVSAFELWPQFCSGIYTGASPQIFDWGGRNLIGGTDSGEM